MSESQSFVCRTCRKNAAMIKGTLYISDGWCTTSCDACHIANMADCFCFANPSGLLFLLRKPFKFFVWPFAKKAQYVVVTPSIPTAEHTRLFFLHCFPCLSHPFFLHTSTTGSIVFCLAASRLTNFVRFAALSQPASST